MEISGKGLALIREFEGLRLEAYLCPANIWTIGYGHTAGVRPGDVITTDQAEAFLREDVMEYEQSVNRYVTVPLTQGQFDALVSFTYNLGSGNLRGSTLLKKLNAGDYAGAADELLRWSRAGGKPLAGLKRRREAEKTSLTRPPDGFAGCWRYQGCLSGSVALTTAGFRKARLLVF